MKKEWHENRLPQDQQELTFSRRKWLEHISLPAIAAAGLSAIPLSSNAESVTGEPGSKMAGANIYNIRNYGAKGDGKTLDTKAVQAAIDACTKDKGGIVLVPAGDFISGTIELKNNVTLHLSAGGRLLGSPRREDYSAGKGVPSGNGNIVFLYAVNANNICIEGRGSIDGNGAAFYNGKGDNTGPGQKGIGGNFDRPHLLIFSQCTRMLIRDIFLTNSAYHCFRILKCKHVNIDAVRIYNRVNKNNDGFHFNDSSYVHISNSDVQCQDDACALFGSNQFVTITNCSFSTRWSIFRFGSGAAQNITVSNCLIYDTYGCPIKISSGRAQLENISFSNIVMRNVTGPISIGFSGAGNQGSSSAAVSNLPATGSFVRNITFNGIRATVVERPVDHPDILFGVSPRSGETNSCISLNAWDENYIENISFTDVHIKYSGGGSNEQAAKRDIPKIAAEYFGVWDPSPGGPPCYGLYARNVKNLSLQNVRFEYEKEDARPAIIFDNVQDASLTSVSAQGNKNDNALMRFINSKDILLSSCRVLSPVTCFLSVEGEKNEGIIVNGGDLRKASKKIAFKDGGKESSVETT